MYTQRSCCFHVCQPNVVDVTALSVTNLCYSVDTCQLMEPSVGNNANISTWLPHNECIAFSIIEEKTCVTRQRSQVWVTKLVVGALNPQTAL